MRNYTIREQIDPRGKSWVINERYVIDSDGTLSHLDMGSSYFPKYLFILRNTLIRRA